MLTLGVDLGGTKVLSALVNESGYIVASERHPSDAGKGVAAVIANITECVEACLGVAANRADALGIGVAGQVEGGGVVRFAPNLEWYDVPLGTKLEETLGIPVVVVNDVRAAAWGEWCYGAARNSSHVVTVFVGTGVGGAVIANGRLLDGVGHTAGELGHVTLVKGGRKCHCPNWGCVEAYVAGWAITERAREAVAADPAGGSALIDLAGSPDAVTAIHVTEAHRSGDIVASDLVSETAEFLASAAIGYVNVFNPRHLVLGGGVIEALPELVETVDERVHELALPAAREDVSVVKAELDGRAGVIGAAALARPLAGAEETA